MAESSSSSVTAESVCMAKPAPKDFSHYYSETTKHRMPSKMKEYYKFFMIPGIGNLAGGLPNLRFFPFDTLEAQTAKPERWTPSPNKPPPPADGDHLNLAQAFASAKLSPSDGINSSRGRQGGAGSDPTAASHITVPKVLSGATTDPVRKIDLATALQYGTAEGYPPLLSWVRQFTRECLHPDVPYAGGPDVCLDVGSTDGFSKTLDMFVDPWSPEKDDVRERPGLLCEQFVYGNVLSQAIPRGVQIVPFAADDKGGYAIGPGGLEDVLSNWDESKGRRPHLYYTVSMGHNPTGVVTSLQRRKEIYAVCSKYDVIIVEDDPYWYLQFPSAAIEEARSRARFAKVAPLPAAATTAGPPYRPETSSGYPFLDSLVPSFLAIDTDGRVVRLDTFSKTVAPGCRLGWITAQPSLIERYVRITETSTQQPSGFVQSVISELVLGGGGGGGASSASPRQQEALGSWLSLRTNRELVSFGGWHMDGWVRWLEGLRGEYERRMNRMCRILDEGSFQLKQGTPRTPGESDWGVVTKTQLYDYSWPRGGMFVWIRVYFEEHPLWGAVGTDGKPVDGTALSTGLMLFLTKKPFLVLVSPGMMFSATDDIRRDIGWQYFRLCFAAEAEEKIDSCSLKFTEGVQKYWRMKKVEELEDLLKDSPVTDGGVDDDEITNLGLYLGC